MSVTSVTSVEFGSIQTRFAWPLLRDDLHSSRNGFLSLHASNTAVHVQMQRQTAAEALSPSLTKLSLLLSKCRCNGGLQLKLPLSLTQAVNIAVNAQMRRQTAAETLSLSHQAINTTLKMQMQWQTAAEILPPAKLSTLL